MKFERDRLNYFRVRVFTSSGSTGGRGGGRGGGDARTIIRQAFRDFLVSPALNSNLNVHKSVLGLFHVRCKILTYFV